MSLKRIAFVGIALLLLAGTLAACARPAAPDPQTLAHAGRLYDNWMTEIKASVPATNQALWSLQTTNTRTGATTWRCKECHGWDYKGKDGAYGKGSRYTGFPGVYKAATTMKREQLLKIMKGETNPSHNFSAVLGEANTSQMVDFLLWGTINMSEYIDYATKKPIKANVTNGKAKYDGNCAACHGSDGKLLNLGSATSPEYIGTKANDNPWEFLHKARFGQPGVQKPVAVVTGWTIQDVVDMLGHAQTLPGK